MAKRNWEFEASKLWPILVDAASSGDLLRYEDLAKVIDTNPLSMRYALEPIFQYCRSEKFPPLSSIVVNKSSGKPGDGFIRDWGENYQDAFAETYAYDWSRVQNPFANYGKEDTSQLFAHRLLDEPDTSATVLSRIKVRGQAQMIFRLALLEAYQNRCAMCECRLEQLLEAAHIAPWSRCDSKQRIDPRNGLLLCANHHKLFDSGVLSLTTDFKVRIGKSSPRALSKADHFLTTDISGSRIHLPEQVSLWPLPEYIDIHNQIYEFELT